jgi:hypothetical protein
MHIVGGEKPGKPGQGAAAKELAVTAGQKDNSNVKV